MSDAPFTVASLFAGCGGSSLGYKMAGGEVRLAVEWDPRAAACYLANFPATPFYRGDIAALSGEEALRLAGLKPGELDVLDGSPPCQGFSTAGKRQYSDPRNSLFREYVRLLEAFRPKAFVMENVSGLAKGKMRRVFREIMAALAGAGYEVRCRLVDAKWLGVPQERKRLIWIGARSDLGIVPEHPKPSHRQITVAEALGLDGKGAADRRAWGSIRNAQFSNKWRGTDRPAPTLEAMRPPMVIVKTCFERARRDIRRPAFKQRAAGPHMIDIGNGPRYLTIEEAKILSGFPSSFKIISRDYGLIGNAVPPPMAKAIAEAVYGSVVLPARERTREAQAPGSAAISDPQILSGVQPAEASA